MQAGEGFGVRQCEITCWWLVVFYDVFVVEVVVEGVLLYVELLGGLFAGGIEKLVQAVVTCHWGMTSFGMRLLVRLHYYLFALFQ